LNANFQSSSRQQGEWFEATCRQVLEAAGFTVDAVHQAIDDAGVEVDIIATNQHAISFFITCKGSYRGRRPGVRRTDTLLAPSARHRPACSHAALPRVSASARMRANSGSA
jgi:hypothetical protein